MARAQLLKHKPAPLFCSLAPASSGSCLLLAPSDGRRGTGQGLVAAVRDSRGHSWVLPGEEDRAGSEVWRTERDSPALMTAGSTPTTVEATATPSLLNYLEL